jgi:hypothetical protein
VHVLVRKISPYTGEDLFLGAFTTIERAALARSAYLARVLHGSDPWADQAYHQVTDNDVVVLSKIPHVGVAESAKRIFVVRSYSEGFGQVVVKIEALTGSLESARDRMLELENQNTDDFPYECGTSEVVVDELYEDGATDVT